MGFKGMIRDIIMFLVGAQLIMGNTNNLFLGSVLIIAAIIFTIIGFLRMTSYV
jgi:hypothetical protein